MQEHLPIMPSTTPVDQITDQLKGQTLRLPNLFGFYSQWPNQISPHYEQLRQTIEAKIDEWIPDEHVRRKARKVDLPMFSATWYPRSTLDRLETMSWYSLWLFLWDDVVEDSAIPSSSETDRVEWLHKHALAYVKFHLGLCEESATEPDPPTKYCTLFKHAGPALREACTVKERQRFFETIREYMAGVEGESDFVRKKELPTLYEYWEYRQGSSSVNTYSALGEYMGGSHIPEHLFDTEEVKTLWFEINRHIVTMNDLVSLKKEIGKSMQSLVPITIHQTGADLDTVVDSLVETLHTSGKMIDQAAERLVVMAEDVGGSDARESVEAYLYAFWTNMTGSYWWSLTCDRYGVKKYLQQDGTLVVPL